MTSNGNCGVTVTQWCNKGAVVMGLVIVIIDSGAANGGDNNGHVNHERRLVVCSQADRLQSKEAERIRRKLEVLMTLKF